MSFNQRQDGSGLPDLENMHGKSRETLAAWINNPQLRRELGAAESAGPSAAHVSQAAASGMVTFAAAQIVLTTQTLNVAILKRINMPDDIVREVAPLDEAEQTAVRESATLFLNEYLPKYLEQMGPGGILLSTIATITSGKFFHARMLLAEQRRARQEADAAESKRQAAAPLEPTIAAPSTVQ